MVVLAHFWPVIKKYYSIVTSINLKCDIRDNIEKMQKKLSFEVFVDSKVYIEHLVNIVWFKRFKRFIILIWTLGMGI